ncbi:MAG: hypothetical protein IPO21_18265 [Bacteroidales bacterium]|nr:hypothetical protein [Bacteroidales bacterium]
MKKVQLSLLAIMAMFFTLSLSVVSCKEDEVEEEVDTVLTGEISADKKLTSDKVWVIKGDVKVKSGVTLTIEAGTTIEAVSSTISYLLIEQGAKIMAEGTATNPIVFTADKKESGAWGSLHICGKAPINLSGGTGSSEIGDAVYGGTDANDNSGVLKYCRFEYTGINLDEEHEANGLTLYGVGAGTTIEYVQIFHGTDDGIEFFGGTVNVKYAYVYGATDDCFDWTYGWSGKGQYWLAKQIEGEGDRGIEADNSGKSNTATPYSNPTLSQVTLIGAGSVESRGMKLREGTKAQIYNVIVTGFKDRSIDVEHNQSILNLNDGSLKVDYAYIDTTVTGKVFNYSVSKVKADTDVNTDGKIDDKDLINDPNAPIINVDMKFEKSANVKRGAETTALSMDGGKDAASLDAFFTADSKIGSGDGWLAGWTK